MHTRRERLVIVTDMSDRDEWGDAPGAAVDPVHLQQLAAALEEAAMAMHAAHEAAMDILHDLAEAIAGGECASPELIATRESTLVMAREFGRIAAMSARAAASMRGDAPGAQ